MEEIQLGQPVFIVIDSLNIKGQYYNIYINIRWEDQEKITKRIAEGPGAALVENNKKGGKKGGKGGKAGGQVVDGTLLGDFRTEYAKSGAAKCRKCEEKIAKVSV